jgi:hypothetical protein
MLKVTFIGGLILGFAATLSAAGFYPWVDHLRVESRTQVLPNGGRQENFFIRLPVDQIATVGSAGLAPGAASYPADLELPEGLTDAPIRVDHFKVRDAMGEVVGVGSRHRTGLADGAAAVWSISLPSRGAVQLVGRMGLDQVSPALARAGYVAGTAWDGTVEVSLGDGNTRTGILVGGSGEFTPLTGTYLERWQITGVDAGGRLQGTIELSTTSYLAQ